MVEARMRMWCRTGTTAPCGPISEMAYIKQMGPMESPVHILLTRPDLEGIHDAMARLQGFFRGLHGVGA